MSLLYKSWILGGIVPGLQVWVQDYEGRYTAVPVDVTLLLKTIRVDVDGLKWNLQKHRIPGFTPYSKGLELALNF